MSALSSAAKPEGELTATWGDTLGCLWTGWSCWIMAWLFLTAWWRPLQLEDGRWVKLGVGVMVLEFILIHSGGVLHHLLEKRAGWSGWRQVAVLVAFYLIFALGIALGFKSWWLLGSFALVMSGRLWSMFAGMTAMDLAIARRRTVASALLYLGLVFATLFLPVPRGGLTPGVLDQVWPDRGGGEWEHKPEKALAMGAAYFLLLGWIEMRPPRRILPEKISNRS